MAFELHAFALAPDGTIHVKHIFYGETRKEADKHFQEHVKGCPMFGPAEKDGRIISYYTEVNELPTEDTAEVDAELAALEGDGEEDPK